MHDFPEYFHKFFISRVYIDKSHIYTWNHYISGCRISKIKNIINHLLFFIFDHTFLLTYVDKGTEFMLGHYIYLCIGINVKKSQHTGGYFCNNKCGWCEKDNQEIYNP